MENMISKIFANRYCYMDCNKKQIEEEYETIETGFNLVSSISESKINKEKFISLSEKEKNNWWGTFAHFRIEVFNSFINALNLLLVGSRNDAIAIIRNILEAEAILEYGLRFNKMQEIRIRFVFGIKKKPGTKKIFHILDKDGEKRYEAWKSYSRFGSHVLPNRMQQNFAWEIEGNVHQLRGGGFLSRRELIQEIIILLQLLAYMAKNNKLFFGKYKGYLIDKDYLKKLDNYLLQNEKIIEKCKK